MHVPVLVTEVLQVLDPQPNRHFIDCTLGGGGHAAAILERTAPRGKLLGLDWDEEAARRAKLNLKKYGSRVKVRSENFANLQGTAAQEGFLQVHGILFDLGMSSDQLEDAGRGFSFKKQGPLDMRFDARNPYTAEKLVNFENKHELARIFKEYGEERHAGKIAEVIVEQRSKKQLKTTQELVAVIERAVPAKYGQSAVQRIFQALRIAVNGELENLRAGLTQASRLTAPDGRLAVISFHSLEDRIVKNFFRDEASLEILTKKPVAPSSKELSQNPRARSAKLRAARKTGI